jgi:hypothetical protein
MSTFDIIIDPFGNEVFLPKDLFTPKVLEVKLLDLFDKPAKVIEAPALMMQVSGDLEENYYYRSVGWDSTLLICTRKIAGRWIAQYISDNPSSKQLYEIYKKGRITNFTDATI